MIFLLGRPKEECYKYLITHVGSLIYYLDSNVVFKEDSFSLFKLLNEYPKDNLVIFKYISFFCTYLQV